MLRAEAEADEPGRNSRQERNHTYYSQNQGRGELFCAPDRPADQSVLDEYLHRLSGAGREFAAPLHGAEVVLGNFALTQRCGQDVGRGDRVLNGEVDPDAPDGGHGVRSVADAQQPGRRQTRKRSTDTLSNLTSDQSFSSAVRSRK